MRSRLLSVEAWGFTSHVMIFLEIGHNGQPRGYLTLGI